MFLTTNSAPGTWNIPTECAERKFICTEYLFYTISINRLLMIVVVRSADVCEFFGSNHLPLNCIRHEKNFFHPKLCGLLLNLLPTTSSKRPGIICLTVFASEFLTAFPRRFFWQHISSSTLSGLISLLHCHSSTQFTLHSFSRCHQSLVL